MPSDAQRKARQSKEAHERARDTMKQLEERDEPPKRLEDWPDDEAKYVTYGGGEGDHGYEDGPERKLGPSSLQRHADGSVSIDGEKDALQAIVDGKMGASVECNPRFGPKAFETLVKYANGEKIDGKLINPDKFYDSSNAAAELPTAY